MAGRVPRISAEKAANLFHIWQSDLEDCSESDDSDYEDRAVRELEQESDSDTENQCVVDLIIDSDCDTDCDSKPIAVSLPSTSNAATNNAGASSSTVVSKPLPTKRKRAASSKAAKSTESDSNWVDITGKSDDICRNTFDFIPSKTSGVQGHVQFQTELESLQVLLTDAIVDHIVDMVNQYACLQVQIHTPAQKRSRYGSWVDVTPGEFYKVLALLITMGLNKKPTIKDYWSTDFVMQSPFFSSVMPRDRFEVIYHSMMHAGKVESQGKSKIEPFLNMLITEFQGAFYPYQDLSIDEMVIQYQGRWKSKQYNPNKPHKYHIKTFGLCDSGTSYVYNFLVYFGKETSYTGDFLANAGQSEKVFETLLENIEAGHHLFADRYYTNYKLIEQLSQRQLYYTGTLMLNRVKFPPEIKVLKLEHRAQKSFRSTVEPDILVTAWRDKKAKKPVVIVSTRCAAIDTVVTNKRGAEVSKPDVIHQYNQSMNGCDRVDQMLQYYGFFTRKTTKWWKRIFYWSLEVTQLNAFILFKLRKEIPKLSFREYKVALVKQLLDKSVSLGEVNTRRSVGRPAACPVERFNSHIRHIVQYNPSDRNCVVCSTPATRRRTNFICSGCSDRPYLHPKECFEIYHTKQP